MISFRRYLLLVGLIVLVVGTCLMTPVRWRAIGWAKGEAFYQGRPTSYWKNNVLAYVRRQEELSAKPSLAPTRIDLFINFICLPSALSPEDLAVLGEDPAAIPVLTQFLADSDPYIRRLSIEVLDNMGPAAQDAVPTLMQCLSDEDEIVRSMAPFALHHIDPEVAAKAGVRLPREEDESARPKVSPDPLVIP